MQERLRKAHARIEELSAALMNEIRRAEAMKVPAERRVRRVASLGPVLRAVVCVRGLARDISRASERRMESQNRRCAE